eukprot:1197119-Rhodomonas_salina.1
MPSQLSRAHDARRKPDPLLGVAQMPFTPQPPQHPPDAPTGKPPLPPPAMCGSMGAAVGAT